jgi:hypothetical protein
LLNPGLLAPAAAGFAEVFVMPRVPNGRANDPRPAQDTGHIVRQPAEYRCNLG